MKNNIASKTLWILFLIILASPSVKQLVSDQNHEVMPLAGAIKKVDLPIWTTSDWFSGSFQKKQKQYTLKNFGFHSFFIRLNNEWKYRLWGHIRVPHVVEGKDKSLIGKNYISSMYGDNYATQIKKLNAKKSAIKTVSNELRKRGKDLVFLINPGKPFLYPEMIPEQLEQPMPAENIYTAFLKFAEAENLSIIDFQKYFIAQKENIPYPIFPKLGTHLSEYAESMIVDSILNYIEQKIGKDLYHYHYAKTKITTTPRGRDNDTEQALNLFYPLTSDTLAYRTLMLDSLNDEEVPDVLVIGDSFHWGIFKIVDRNGLFGRHQFWYRNHSIFPGRNADGVKVATTKTAVESLDKFDFVFIVVTSMAMDEAGWKYFKRIERALESSPK